MIREFNIGPGSQPSLVARIQEFPPTCRVNIKTYVQMLSDRTCVVLVTNARVELPKLSPTEIRT